MKALLRKMASRIFALATAFMLAFAAASAQAQPAYTFSQQELDQMLAPIALYPDALLSQILVAATYPLEVAEAARRASARPDLSGDDAVRAGETENWDPSVNSLLAFPQVLVRMGENPQWTQALGNAYLAQPSQVMDTVQALRRRAQATGALRSDERMNVVESGPSLLVEPFDSQAVYVPDYDAQVVYGSWWWPAYPPMYLRPWAGHYARPAYAGGFYWGPPVRISSRSFFGTIDWRRRQVRMPQVNNTYYRGPTAVRQTNANPQLSVNRPGASPHDADPRRSLALPSADARQRFSAPPELRSPGRATDTRGADARPDARFETRRAAGIAAEAHGGRAAATQMQREPSPRSEHSRETRIRAEWHASPQVARLAPSVHPEATRAPARMEVRPAPSAARQELAHTAVTRHEPAARHQAPR